MMHGLKQPFMYTSVEQKMAACLGGYIELALPKCEWAFNGFLTLALTEECGHGVLQTD